MITFVLLISVLSGNGFHSIPAILLINGTARLPYHGPKDLNSPVYFYHRSISCGIQVLPYFVCLTFFIYIKKEIRWTLANTELTNLWLYSRFGFYDERSSAFISSSTTVVILCLIIFCILCNTIFIPQTFFSMFIQIWIQSYFWK